MGKEQACHFGIGVPGRSISAKLPVGHVAKNALTVVCKELLRRYLVLPFLRKIAIADVRNPVADIAMEP